MKHVAPHRWADAWAGKLSMIERAELDTHAAECPQCTKTRERVTRASDSFATIKGQSSPDLSWDAVRAQVHWSVSTERRSKIDLRRRPTGWAFAGAVAAAAVVTTLAVGTDHGTSISPVVAVQPREIHAAPTAKSTPLVGLINRTTGDVMVDGIRPADPFALHLAAGTVIATGEGRVDVQFGDASALALGPHSRLSLVKFDSRAIELAIDGTIDVDVAPRAQGQTFIVNAGTHAIEVRGTQFRVNHAAANTTVACRHGLVSIDNRTHTVGAARRVELGAPVPHVVAMTTEELSELVDATPIRMPVWDLGTLAGSAPLDIATAGHREVRLDGVEVGLAPMHVRVMPGRHTVEAADSQGRYRRAGWIDVTPKGKPARLEIQPETSTIPNSSGVDARRREFTTGIDRGKLAACTRPAAKQGLLAAGAYVKIEISVDAQGAVGYLNVLETDLSHRLAECVGLALKDVRFKAGASATWSERIDL